MTFGSHTPIPDNLDEFSPTVSSFNCMVVNKKEDLKVILAAFVFGFKSIAATVISGVDPMATPVHCYRYQEKSGVRVGGNGQKATNKTTTDVSIRTNMWWSAVSSRKIWTPKSQRHPQSLKLLQAVCKLYWPRCWKVTSLRSWKEDPDKYLPCNWHSIDSTLPSPASSHCCPVGIL